MSTHIALGKKSSATYKTILHKLRIALVALSLSFCPMLGVHAAVGISIGINMPVYPNLVVVPGYPVYYDPDASANYFFYDGEYWVYQNDNWYSSTWYNGPWDIVDPNYVPLFLLRVPVSYYREPPTYFRGWASNAPPRWGDHWGHTWEARRGGWDQWDHHAVHAAAPLPTYQRSYSGNNYPRAVAQQQSIRAEKYHYQPHEAITKQHFQQQSKPTNARLEPQRSESPNRAPNPQRTNQPPSQQRVSEQSNTPRTDRPPHAQTNQDRSNQDRAIPERSAQEHRQSPPIAKTPPPQQRPQPERREPSHQPPPQMQRPQPAPKPQEHPQGNESAPQERERQNGGEERGEPRR